MYGQQTVDPDRIHGHHYQLHARDAERFSGIRSHRAVRSVTPPPAWRAPTGHLDHRGQVRSTRPTVITVRNLLRSFRASRYTPTPRSTSSEPWPSCSGRYRRPAHWVNTYPRPRASQGTPGRPGAPCHCSETLAADVNAASTRSRWGWRPVRGVSTARRRRDSASRSACYC